MTEDPSCPIDRVILKTVGYEVLEDEVRPIRRCQCCQRSEEELKAAGDLYPYQSVREAKKRLLQSGTLLP